MQQALEARPELARAAAELRAAKERVPQAEAWAEPMLEVGVQNDSFNKWNVGVMEMSWVSFMASQTFPFPGKTGLRAEVAQSEVKLSELVAERVRLSTIAEVRRGYLALQLVRDRRALLEKLITLNTRLVEVARVRSESGAGSQAEVLRAQVELGRVSQRRFQLQAEEQLQVQALNRLRHRPLDTAIQTSASPSTLPALLSFEQALTLAREHSPELLAARAGISRAQASAALARRSYFPDLSVSAGVMVRGRLDPMWTLTLGVPLPVFAGARQSRALAEADAQRDAATQGVEAVEQLLTLRAHQRAESLKALSAVWQSYAGGLLTQAETAAESTVAQYAIGRATFADVLGATSVSIAEVEASLQVLGDAWRLAIAQDELSPEEVATARAALSSPSTSSAPTGM
ncbi:MAG: TolC family protein [Archangium sp.]|nr:TolC family protein [Archangium sp.]